MKIKYKELKKWVLIFLLINSSIIFSFCNQITSNYLYNKPDGKSYDLEFINNLGISSYLTYHENFQSIEFNNYSVTNATGWGDGSLHLPHQNLLNISLFTENLDCIKTLDFFENYLLIADNNLGLKIIDFSNPLNPYLISSFGDTYNETLDISIEGRYAYVADGLDGLEILEITDPTSPQKISSWSNSNNITNVFIKDKLAFLSIRDFGVQILNISNPYSISKVGNWTNLESPCRVDIVGNYLFIVNENDDLEIIDITDIKNIFKVGQLNITGKCNNFQVRGNYLYLA
ncbi:MAG: LVIVD repeat-containing protein, partial [Candidatus Odinarchaeota archaeon]